VKIGFIINPCAGVGGKLALKGSDDLFDHAVSLGAKPQAFERSRVCIEKLLPYKNDLQWWCAPKQMGHNLLTELGFDACVIDMVVSDSTSSESTKQAVELLLRESLDLLLFAGGDGTARDISVLVGEQLALGIPAGVKIQSGVYGITPKACAEVIKQLLQHEQVSAVFEEVRDIDEQALRAGTVNSKYFGEMRVPCVPECIQAVKMGAIEDPEANSIDIAQWFSESMEEGVCYFVGAGRTLQFLMDELQLENTLLGVDAVVCQDGQAKLLGSDLTEQELLALSKAYHCQMVVSVIGGQGHILGRGNQQFSAQVLRSVGIDHLHIVATRAKLHSLNKRPLITDTHDENLDTELTGLRSILVGYDDYVVYQVN
jgi:predicted polyphosphate/ATP-dependent NAD kinase